MTQQLILPFLPAANYSLETWVQDEGNQEAFSWVDHWPDWPIPRFVCFYGEAGSGKTHLAHICAYKSEGIYLKASQAYAQNPYHLSQSKRVLILDEAETLQESGLNHEEWLFHFYNLIQENQGYVLLISRKAPPHWQVDLPDLKSRLKTIINVEIKPPSDKVLQAVFLKLLQERGLIVKQEVIEYLLKHSERSFLAINTWATQLDQLSAEKSRAITIPFIREILEQS